MEVMPAMDEDGREREEEEPGQVEASGESSSQDVQGQLSQDVETETAPGGNQPGEFEEGEPPRCLPCPGAPSLADRVAHEVAHFPYRKWCEHCVRGRAVGTNSKSVPEGFKESMIPRAHLDYAFVQEEIIEEVDEFEHSESVQKSLTMMVMWESLCDSVWAYAVQGKGVMSDPWLPSKIAEDLSTAGMPNSHIVLKTDTEPAIVEVRREIAKSRKEAPTTFDDARVGDSNSNAKIERTIRDVKGLIRTLRSALSEKIKEPVTIDSPIIPWLIRHAAYIITRCKIHSCGRTPMERIKGRKAYVALIPFGEAVMFKLPKTNRRTGDLEDRFEKGIWVGCTVRSGEHIVALANGTFRVGSIIRCAPDMRWSASMMNKIKGTPKEPNPNSGSSKIPVYVRNKTAEAMGDNKFEPVPIVAPIHRPAYIYKRDVEEHGATPSCRGCEATLVRGNNKGYPHSAACRLRFEEIFQEFDAGRLQRADERAARPAAVPTEQEGTPPVQEAVQGEEGEKEDTPMNQPLNPDVEPDVEIEIEAEVSAPAAPSSLPTNAQLRARLEHRRLTRDEFGREMRGAKRQTNDAPGEQLCPDDGQGSDADDMVDSSAVASTSPSAEAGSLGMHVPMTPVASHVLSRGAIDVRGNGTDREERHRKLIMGNELIAELHSGGARTEVPVVSKAAPAVKPDVDPKIVDHGLGGDDIEHSQIVDRIRQGQWETVSDALTVDSCFVGPNTSVVICKNDPNKNATEKQKPLSKHPGPVVQFEEITKGDQQWTDIGSGTFARSFLDAKRFVTTTRGGSRNHGPAISDVHRRTTWSLTTGKIIDDCLVDDVPDIVLHREMPIEDNIRVELVMKQALDMYHRSGSDVSEIYSVPRIVQEAAVRTVEGQRLQPGWSLDLTRVDPKTNEPWNLNDPKVQARVKKMVTDDKPLFLIGSPPCTPFSLLQNINKERRDPKIVEAEIRAGEAHLKFCCELYFIQLRGGRCFVHEHPAEATSWSRTSMCELAAHPEVGMAIVDMCVHGMKVDVGPVQGPARKRTRVFSNSHEVLKRIASQCPNDRPDKALHHVHVPLDQGRAKRCQVYPRSFCRRVCEGIAAEKRLRSLGLKAIPLMTLEAIEEAGIQANDVLHDPDGTWACDDQSGESLRPELVREARKEEMRYFRDMKVYEKVDIAECWAATGKAPIGVRWVDINKGDVAQPNYRSRLVAKEFKTEERPEWYAATPPGECLKIILSKMASNRKLKMLYADVSRAYFYAPALRPVYVKLPEEDRGEGDAQKCGKLNVSMYGTRDAALNWAIEYGETLKQGGFQQGRINPCLFYHPGREVTIMVHGDDFVAVGEASQLQDTEKLLSDRYKIKTEMLGSGKSDVKEVKVLNKIIRLTEDGIELEADPRHAELVAKELGVEGCNPSKTPGVKHPYVKPQAEDDWGQNGEADDMQTMTCEGEMARRSNHDDTKLGSVVGSSSTLMMAARPPVGKDEHTQGEGVRPKPAGNQCYAIRREGGEVAEIVSIDNVEEFEAGVESSRRSDWSFLSADRESSDPELPPTEATSYRGTTARLNYVASDRVDIQYATKEAARSMSKPLQSAYGGVTRIGKYLVGRPRMIMHFKWQAMPALITTYTDSDWAGCEKTAKSTSGGIICIGGHMIKSYSRQQKTVALSSAEAELHAMVAASAETLGVIGLCGDMGITIGGEVYADSSAALGITQRTGNGKVRHLRVQSLWVQEVRCTGRLGYKKVLGTLNPADILTKHVPSDLLEAHLKTLGVEFRGGRAVSAPNLSINSLSRESYEDEADPEEDFKTVTLGRSLGRDVARSQEGKSGRKDRRVSFAPRKECRAIPAEGRQRPTHEARRIKARAKGPPGKEEWSQEAQRCDDWADEDCGSLGRGDDEGEDWVALDPEVEPQGEIKSCMAGCPVSPVNAGSVQSGFEPRGESRGHDVASNANTSRGLMLITPSAGTVPVRPCRPRFIKRDNSKDNEEYISVSSASGCADCGVSLDVHCVGFEVVTASHALDRDDVACDLLGKDSVFAKGEHWNMHMYISYLPQSGIIIIRNHMHDIYEPEANTRHAIAIWLTTFSRQPRDQHRSAKGRAGKG